MAKRASVVLQDNGHRKLTPSFRGRSLSCFLAACCPWLQFSPYITDAGIFFEHTSKKCSQKWLVWLLINIKNTFFLCVMCGEITLYYSIVQYILLNYILLNYILFYLNYDTINLYILLPQWDGWKVLQPHPSSLGWSARFIARWWEQGTISLLCHTQMDFLNFWAAWLTKGDRSCSWQGCFLSSRSVQGLESDWKSLWKWERGISQGLCFARLSF